MRFTTQTGWNEIAYNLNGAQWATQNSNDNPTLADLDWKALPFSLASSGAIDRHKHTASAEGTLNLFVEAKAERGFYKVSFRVPGANTGTP